MRLYWNCPLPNGMMHTVQVHIGYDNDSGAHIVWNHRWYWFMYQSLNSIKPNKTRTIWSHHSTFILIRIATKETLNNHQAFDALPVKIRTSNGNCAVFDFDRVGLFFFFIRIQTHLLWIAEKPEGSKNGIKWPSSNRYCLQNKCRWTVLTPSNHSTVTCNKSTLRWRIVVARWIIQNWAFPIQHKMVIHGLCVYLYITTVWDDTQPNSSCSRFNTANNWWELLHVCRLFLSSHLFAFT